MALIDDQEYRYPATGYGTANEHDEEVEARPELMLHIAVQRAIDDIIPDGDDRPWPFEIERIEVIGSRRSPGKVHEYRVKLKG